MLSQLKTAKALYVLVVSAYKLDTQFIRPAIQAKLEERRRRRDYPNGEPVYTVEQIDAPQLTTE